MTFTTVETYTAFHGVRILARGTLEEVVTAVKRNSPGAPSSDVLIFSDSTGNQMEFINLRGSEKEVLDRLRVFIEPRQKPPVSEGPGRPRLGVVAREVSLLPRHWEWLSMQSGGASATLRRLVEEARKHGSSRELVRKAQERTHKFMTAIAGDLPHYEEALRALYARDRKKLRAEIAGWPSDIKEYACTLAAAAFEKEK